MGLGKTLLDEGGLAGSPGAKQKVGLFGQQFWEVDGSGVHAFPQLSC